MTQKSQLEDVFQIISRFPEGISTKQLVGFFENKISRRTLQRDLNELILQNRYARILLKEKDFENWQLYWT
jgi:hypothetical protein